MLDQTSQVHGETDKERRSTLEARVGRFDGVSGGKEDIYDWLDKVAFNLEDFPGVIKDEARFIGSMLGQDVWQAFMHLDDDIKKDATKLKKWLKNAYGIRPDEAYRQLRHRVMKEDETVQAYVTDFRRLKKRTGIKDGGPHSWAMMFTDGLLDYLRQGLAAKGGAKSIEEAVAILRDVEVANSLARKGGAVAKTVTPSTVGVSGGSRPPGVSGGSRSLNKVECYICRGRHFRRDCPHKGDVKYMRCYRCTLKGHLAKDCLEGQSQQPSTLKPVQSGNREGTSGMDGTVFPSHVPLPPQDAFQLRWTEASLRGWDEIIEEYSMVESMEPQGNL